MSEFQIYCENLTEFDWCDRLTREGEVVGN